MHREAVGKKKEGCNHLSMFTKYNLSVSCCLSIRLNCRRNNQFLQPVLVRAAELLKVDVIMRCVFCFGIRLIWQMRNI